MKFVWDKDLPLSSKRMFYNQSSKLFQDCTSFELSSILFGLKEMKYDWKNNSKLEQAILDAIIANYGSSASIEKSSRANDLANTMYNLGDLSKERKKEDKIVLNKTILEAFWNGIKICAIGLNAHSLRLLLTGYFLFQFSLSLVLHSSEQIS
jgi:hypothetical protein